MIKLNKMTDYAAVLLSVLAHNHRQEAARYASSAEIASGAGLTRTTAAKLLKSLAAAKLVVAERGKCGGYKLARNPENITVSQIIEALEGPIALTACVEAATDPCSSRKTCFLGGHWEKINIAIAQALDEVTLADLCDPASMFPTQQTRQKDRATNPSKHTPAKHTRENA